MHQTRIEFNFDFDWRFHQGDVPEAYSEHYDGSTWREVDVPHDWSIEGPFTPEYASSTGYAPGGVGWYRKRFFLDSAHQDRMIAVEFDGVYCNSEVWINGQFIGRRPYGYSSFQYDLTPYLHFDAENILAVRVDHTKHIDSRWYTGSGIYRHVRLRITHPLRIAHWGTFVSTPEISDQQAKVRVETRLQNGFEDGRDYELLLTILSPDGGAVACLAQNGEIEGGGSAVHDSELAISNPLRWTLEAPALYQLKSELRIAGETVDETITPFGVRSIAFDPDKGFFLNGRGMKIKGACLHHDAGCLGAAVPDRVLERRLQLLKSVGCNAIRTSHNPPAPELLDMCDRMGLLVQDEAFDEFTPAKNKWIRGRNVGLPARYGYAQDFEQWAERDIQDMVRRDRNHPCVIMWSIVNEVDYANDPFSHPVLGEEYRPHHPRAEKIVSYARRLAKAVKQLDTTRPVTAALANPVMSNAVGFPEELDIVGYNYMERFYAEHHQAYPRRVIYGSENSHSHKAWMAVRDNEYICGQFLWTAFDFLGEAPEWPSRIFNSGLFDTTGYKKPLGWLRQSLWTQEPMAFACALPVAEDEEEQGMPAFFRRWRLLREDWNWPEGSRLELMIASNCPEVIVQLNGRELDVLRQTQVDGWLRLVMDYEPGELLIIGRRDGMELCRFSLRTAGAAQRIELRPDVVEMHADGRDVCHLELIVVDENGVRVPDADHEVNFSVEGHGRIIGLDNGWRDGHGNYQGLRHNVWQGRGLAVIQAGRAAGAVRIKVQAPGLEAATITLQTR
ncbi:beta galactosidase jelly roll domain-containing protein [Candidatus Sumerlaeota bacterium]|nr:beta galactosidase jelly roll domain-containing protein [Candidatus Sumerlaeota bacterium]